MSSFASKGLALLLFAGALLSGCSEKSLVGSPNLPPDEMLARQQISLRLAVPESAHNGMDILSIDVLPNNSYQTQRTRLTFSKRGEPPQAHDVRVEKGVLPVEQAKAIRRMLARLQPAKLGPDWPFSQVEGCGFVSDGRPDIAVNFVDEKQGGLFTLFRDCDTPDARRARKLVDDVRALVPGALAKGPILY